MSYLIHYNKNHNPKNGQFAPGDGNGDGVVGRKKITKYQNEDGSLNERGKQRYMYERQKAINASLKRKNRGKEIKIVTDPEQWVSDDKKTTAKRVGKALIGAAAGWVVVERNRRFDTSWMPEKVYPEGYGPNTVLKYED